MQRGSTTGDIANRIAASVAEIRIMSPVAKRL